MRTARLTIIVLAKRPLLPRRIFKGIMRRARE
jgi:hypothetical protein